LTEATAISNHAAGLVIREVGTCVTSVEALRESFANHGGSEPEELSVPSGTAGEGSPPHGPCA
jgi:bifunctional ADP-heptose synthase (sugar kinase/adenylyltransferase)